MKYPVLFMLLSVLGCGGVAAAELQAHLEAQTNRPGWFLIHVTNISSNAVRLLDVREGSGFCGDFYEVTCERDGKGSSSNGNSFYSPGFDPAVVEIAPGQTYRREIQPSAYLYVAKDATAEQLTVTYRVSDRMREGWSQRADGANLSLTFRTDEGLRGSANQAVQRTGASRSPAATNRASSAAGSRR